MKLKELFKKYSSCKYRGHIWKPVYIKGTYNKKEVKFIACYCKRCYKGHNEVTSINSLAIDRKYGTYSEEYFN